jgi:hypothetical protein
MINNYIDSKFQQSIVNDQILTISDMTILRNLLNTFKSLETCLI